MDEPTCEWRLCRTRGSDTGERLELPSTVDADPRMLALVASRTDNAVVITDADLGIVWVNDGFTRISGYRLDEVRGRDPATFLRGPNTDPATLARIQGHLARGEGFRAELLRYAKTGREYWSEIDAQPVHDCGRLVYVIAIESDLTARKQLERQLADQLERTNRLNDELALANAQLSELAATDSLTGLSNLRAFGARLAVEAAEGRQRPLSLILLDVDRFKMYNDAFGHPAGDVVLRRVANLLRTEVRADDLAARPGGEEFAVLAPGTDTEAALALAERLRLAIASQGWPLRPVTVSLGVTTTSDPRPDVNALVEEADRALYAAKQMGRDRVVHRHHLDLDLDAKDPWSLGVERLQVVRHEEPVDADRLAVE